MDSLEIFFLDFQSLLIAQDNKLCIHMREVGKMVLFFLVRFYPKKSLQGETSPYHKKKLASHCKNDMLRSPNGLHILIVRYLSIGKFLHILFLLIGFIPTTSPI